MAITLEEAKKNVQDDLQLGVIDEFQKSNWILEHIPLTMPYPLQAAAPHRVTVTHV